MAALTLIQVNDSLIINPAHIAFAERQGDLVLVRMAVSEGDLPAPVFVVKKEDAPHVWGQLAALTGRRS